MGSESIISFIGAPTILVELLHHLEYLESSWSRFRKSSDLTALNASAGTPHKTPNPLFKALLLAQQATMATHGLFDPAVGAALNLGGYDRTWFSVDKSLPRRPGKPSLGFLNAALDTDTQEVTLPLGMSVDLGGIGKGMAADSVSALALSLGAERVAVSVGGDVSMRSSDAHKEGFMSRIDLPDGTSASVSFDGDGAIATSSPAYHTLANGWHHIIDPATGDPAQSEFIQVSAIAASAALAEAFATAFFVAGDINLVAPLAKEADIAAVLVTENTTYRISSSLHEVL